MLAIASQRSRAARLVWSNKLCMMPPWLLRIALIVEVLCRFVNKNCSCLFCSYLFVRKDDGVLWGQPDADGGSRRIVLVCRQKCRNFAAVGQAQGVQDVGATEGPLADRALQWAERVGMNVIRAQQQIDVGAGRGCDWGGRADRAEAAAQVAGGADYGG